MRKSVFQPRLSAVPGARYSVISSAPGARYSAVSSRKRVASVLSSAGGTSSAGLVGAPMLNFVEEGECDEDIMSDISEL